MCPAPDPPLSPILCQSSHIEFKVGKAVRTTHARAGEIAHSGAVAQAWDPELYPYSSHFKKKARHALIIPAVGKLRHEDLSAPLIFQSSLIGERQTNERPCFKGLEDGT